MKEYKRSVCPYDCPDACSLLVEVENGQAQADRLQRASKAPFFGAHNLIHGLKAGIPCWAWVSEGVAVLKNREKMDE